MVDVQTTTAIAAIGYPLVQKVLGPSSEYLGDQLKLFTQKNTENLKRIFEKTESKHPEGIEQQGSVSPQILRDVLFDGSFCEDEISQEYYAGVLASSKSKQNRDNRGVDITACISRLSNYQLRAHYFFYYVMHQSKIVSESEIQQDAILNNTPVFISNKTFIEAMDFDAIELTEFDSICGHILHGLNKENLINRTFGYGSVEFLRSRLPSRIIFDEPGLVVCPSPLGIELFLWASGKGKLPLNYFYNSEFQPPKLLEGEF